MSFRQALAPLVSEASPRVAANDGGAGSQDRRAHPGWQAWARRALTVVVILLAVYAIYDRRSQIVQASTVLSRVKVGWLLLAVWAEMASMVVFARLQRWLLRAGGVRVGLLSVFEITLAGNALSTSLPGGPAWSATWVFEQLRRRNAGRVLAGWVILVAGALSSFAIFVVLAAGAWVAGSRGPVAPLRWLVLALAAIPVAVSAGYVAARQDPLARRVLAAAWVGLSRNLRPARFVGHLVRTTVRQLGLVRPGARGWAEAFALAMANWLCDALCLVACCEALGVPVPWRGILVVYGLTQVAASLPITPGGIGVVEGSMTALLVAYGTRPSLALAVVLLYRIVSFWAFVPIGWGTWFVLELAVRRGLRRQPHPWAEHDHGPGPILPTKIIGPERLLPPSPCHGCAAPASVAPGEQPARDNSRPVPSRP
jgi:putative heme transporter